VRVHASSAKALKENPFRRLRPLLDLPVELVLPAHGEPRIAKSLQISVSCCLY